MHPGCGPVSADLLKCRTSLIGTRPAPFADGPDALRFLLPLGLLLVLAAGVVRAGDAFPRVQEVAIPYARPATVPAASDVIMRTLRFHPMNKNDRQDTFNALDDFHVTRLEWTYLAGNQGSLVKRVLDSGRLFGGACNSSSGTFVQGLEDGKHVKKYTIVDAHGHPVIHGHMRHWAHPQSPGCVNDPDYRKGCLDYFTSYVNAGVASMQRDEPSTQTAFAKAGVGCFCPHCMDGFRGYLKRQKSDRLQKLGIADAANFDYRAFVRQCAPAQDAPGFDWSDPKTVKRMRSELGDLFVEFQTRSATAFFQWLRKEVETCSGRRIIFTCNNTSFQDWEDPAILTFDFCISELMMRSATPQHIYERAQKARSLGKMQVFGSPKTMGKAVEEAALTRLKRQVIATSYASGALAMVPWDVFMQSPDGKERYFGSPETYADLFAYVRASHRFLDEYSSAGAFGPGMTNRLYGKTPPLEVNSEYPLYAFVRTVPKGTTRPVVVHLVDWSDTGGKPVTVRLRTACFFPGQTLRVELRTPAPYQRKDHMDAERNARAIWKEEARMGPAQSGAYESLVRTEVLQTRKDGDWTVVRVPRLNPWGMLILEPDR